MSSTLEVTEDLSRATVIARIKAALKQRSGRPWSVTGGRGTAYGWIRIASLPSEQTRHYRLKAGMADIPENYEAYEDGTAGGYMTEADCALLAQLLSIETVHLQGYRVPASSDHYCEALDRSEGKPVRKIAEQYWD